MQTCGVLKFCKDSGCERSYDNPCSAFSNIEIEGYYTGECQNNYV